VIIQHYVLSAIFLLQKSTLVDMDPVRDRGRHATNRKIFPIIIL